MTERIKETRIIEHDEPEQTQTAGVRSDEDVATTDSTITAARVVRYLTVAIIALLAMRFGLSLLGANKGNAFADLIYTLSYPFAAPFFGLFGYQVSYGASRFEVETLVAMAVFALLGYGVARLMTINRRDQTVV